MKDSYTMQELESLFGSSKVECARAKFFINARPDGKYQRSDVLQYTKTIGKVFHERIIERMIRGRYGTIETR